MIGFTLAIGDFMALLVSAALGVAAGVAAEMAAVAGVLAGVVLVARRLRR